VIAAVVLLVWGVAAAEAAPLKLTTQWKGPAMALEIYDGGSNTNFAHLAPAANGPAQQWRQDTRHAFMQLTNVLRGAKMCFGVIKA
jgi:hypothetical protein